MCAEPFPAAVIRACPVRVEAKRVAAVGMRTLTVLPLVPELGGP